MTDKLYPKLPTLVFPALFSEAAGTGHSQTKMELNRLVL